MATAVLDLDGTIIDSTKRHYLLLEKLLQDNSIYTNINPQDYLSYKRDGYNNYDFLTKKLEINPQIANEIQKKWVKDIESSEWISTDTLYPDTIKFLNELKDLGYNIIFLTARQNQKSLYKELENLSLTIFPNQIIVVQGSKIKAFRDISDYPKIMIGDTEMDFEAAKEANAPSYILGRGLRSPHFLHKLGIKKIYDNLDEIISELHDISH